MSGLELCSDPACSSRQRVPSALPQLPPTDSGTSFRFASADAEMSFFFTHVFQMAYCFCPTVAACWGANCVRDPKRYNKDDMATYWGSTSEPETNPLFCHANTCGLICCRWCACQCDMCGHTGDKAWFFFPQCLNASCCYMLFCCQICCCGWGSNKNSSSDKWAVTTMPSICKPPFPYNKIAKDDDGKVAVGGSCAFCVGSGRLAFV